MKVLIIKGDRFVAAKSAAKHNVPFVFTEEVLADGRCPAQTAGKTNADADVLNKWFCETTKAPYPAGALLWWG